jgi:hypothetical protein
MPAINACIENANGWDITTWPSDTSGEIIGPRVLITRNIICEERWVIASASKLCNGTRRE